jgi:hypothetical protein
MFAPWGETPTAPPTRKGDEKMPKKVMVMEECCKKVEKEAFQCEVCGQKYKQLILAQECEAKETTEYMALDTEGAIYVTGEIDHGWDDTPSTLEDIDEFWHVVDRITYRHKSYPVVENTQGKRVAVGFYYWLGSDDNYESINMDTEEDSSEFVMVSWRQLEVVAEWLKQKKND